MASLREHREWSRDGFVVSTDPRLVSLSALNAAFVSDMLYWAKPLPTSDLQAMVENSLCFGLYTPTPDTAAETASTTIADPKPQDTSLLGVPTPSATPSRPISPSATTGASQIGFARVVTDYVTLAYLTDVYVLPAWQAQGLASWLISCVQETIESMPHLRRSLLLTSGGDGKAIPFYEKRMKMSKIEGPLTIMSWRGPGSLI